MEKINSLNPTDLRWHNDIGFDEKSKEEIKSLYRKVGPSKETVERYIIQQLQSKRAKYHRSMNKVLKKFYVKHKDTLIHYYTDLKVKPQEYYIQLNQLLTQVVVEWIVTDIKQENAEEAVDLFLQEFV